MPGITGIIRKLCYPEMDRDLNLMIDAMRHESRYSSGRYADKELGIGVGWVSHPGSFSDCMPLVSRSDDIVLIFHGESYSASPGHGRTPNASYLMDLCAESGDEFY